MADFCGYERVDFTFEGHSCIWAKPKRARKDGAWLWRAEFFGAFAQVDEAMLADGYSVAYVSLSDRYGCPSAVEDMAKFHDYACAEMGLSAKPIVEGFSRGGLYAVNYALAYPERVDKLYLDAPVLDIRSWPGRSPESREWRECMACYGLTPETAKDFDQNPLDNAEKLAKTGIPVMLVAGDADAVVPMLENAAPFAERFRAAGGTLSFIVKPGCDHHPHSVKDVRPVVEFLERKRA